jgi:hypothetical protein
MSSSGKEPGDVVATFFQQLGSMSPHKHASLVLSNEMGCCLLFRCRQSLVLTLKMKSFEATAGLGRERISGGTPERVIVEGLEVKDRVGEILG